MTEPSAESRHVPLSPRERRVLGVLVEKQKTTPDAYPMSIAALVTGCNQKSNRDPVTDYDADDVEETLQGLRQKGVAVRIEGSGRVERWKHNLYEWLDLKGRPVELAVLAELMLRGPQTEGELRGRASRMDEIADLDALHRVLEGLADRGLVVHLSPPGQRRGVVVTHGLYPSDELERVRGAHASAPLSEGGGTTRTARPSAAPSAELAAEVAGLRAELDALRTTVESLAADVRVLKDSLGG